MTIKRDKNKKKLVNQSKAMFFLDIYFLLDADIALSKIPTQINLRTYGKWQIYLISYF